MVYRMICNIVRSVVQDTLYGVEWGMLHDNYIPNIAYQLGVFRETALNLYSLMKYKLSYKLATPLR